MTRLPPLATRDRVTDVALVVSFGILQAAALAVAAFAMRDAFAALHSGNALATGTICKLALSGAVAALCLFMSRRHAEALGQTYAIALRRTLYAQIARLPKSRHETRRVGALSLRFVGDLSAARLWFGRGLPDVISTAVILPGAVAILLALDPVLAASGLVPLGLALAIMCATAWRLERRHRQLRQRRANIAIAMIERIAIAPELDLMGRTEKELQALGKQGASLKNDAVARRGRTAGLQAILQVGVAVSGLAMLWFAGRHGTAPAVVAAGLSVLALIALPLQDLGAAWDRYCAWRVAREKAQRLLDEPTLRRRSKPENAPVSVALRGRFEGAPVTFFAAGADIAYLGGWHARMLARIIAGLDRHDDVEVLFDGQIKAPKIGYIGDDHVGLQGSLRRSATLTARKRPKDSEIRKTLAAFGLSDLLSASRGLDQRLAENGKDLTAMQTLRLDLVRMVLGKADVVVISSLRWWADPDRDNLLETLGRLNRATVILADPANTTGSLEDSKAL